MRGHPGHNTQPHDRLPVSFSGMDAWMTSQNERSFESKATWVIDVLGLLF